MLLIVAILVIYIVLGILYESFIHPITILSGLPSAVFGALLTLLIFHKELDLYAFVGLIMLFGVVKKNAIMMIDFAIDAQRRGQERARSDLQRLHSALPSDHDDHRGGAVRHTADRAGVRRGRRRASAARPRGGRRTVVRQFLTLYITPVIYLYLEKLQELARARADARSPPSSRSEFTRAYKVHPWPFVSGIFGRHTRTLSPSMVSIWRSGR